MPGKDSEADRRRDASIYEREQMVPERLLHDLAETPVFSEEEIDSGVTKGSHRGELTPAELEVVRLMSHGYNTKMIAEQRERSVETIKKQQRSARAALNAKTREHLVAVALRQGLID